MEFDDRVTIATPEGVTLDLTLAGIGSRLTAAVLDLLVQGTIIIALTIVSRLLNHGGGAVAVAIATVLSFGVVFGYDVLFETLVAGRTPGKRWTGLRVVRSDGRPVTFLVSAVRNLLRLIDFLPFSYAVGAISVLVSPRNQRLGDLAAGTLVVRERKGNERSAVRSTAELWSESAPVDTEGWDVSAVTADELAAVRQFLQRRRDLQSDARARLARHLADQLRAKVVSPDPGDYEHPEDFLSKLAAVKAARW